MGRRRWGACAGAIAVIVPMAIGAAGPARATGPKGTAPAAASADLVEAKRLAAEAEQLRRQGKYDDALPLGERALSLREKALGPDHLDVAASVNELAHAYFYKGDYASAERLYQRALGLREKALGPDHQLVAKSLGNLANTYMSMGDYARSEMVARRSLAIWEKAVGPDHPDLATSLNNLANLFLYKGDYALAKPHYERVLAIREKALGAADPLVADALINVALTRTAMGEYAATEALLTRAISIYEEALGPDNPRVAEALSKLANVRKAKGDYARADALLTRSLSIFEKVLGPDHPDVAYALNTLAGLCSSKGDYARAEALYNRARSIWEKALGPEHPIVAASLTNLAGMHNERGDYASAEPLLKRALAIRTKALDPNHPDVPYTLDALGLLYVGKGDYASAEPLFNRALAIREKALGVGHYLVAGSLIGLARMAAARGDYARAEPLLKRSLALRTKALGEGHPDVGAVWSYLAVAFAARGRLAEAVDAARRATDIQDYNAPAILATGSEEQKRLYMGTLASQTEEDIALHLQLAPANRDAARLALEALLRRKGRVLDAMADSLAALRRSLSPGDRDQLDQLARVYSQLATQLARGPGNTPPDHYRKDLAALEEARQTLEADIGQRSAVFRAEPRVLTLGEVQGALPEGAALVEIARYKPLHFRAGASSKPGGEPRYAAYVVGRSGDPAFVDLGAAAPLDAAIGALRRALADHDRSRDPKPAARALDRLLMQPIRGLLGEARWVFLSPDGPLHLIPFGALIDEEGHYLVERYLFSYLTTGRDLLRFGDKRPAPREAPLVLAAPAFNDLRPPRGPAPASSPAEGPEATHRGLRSIDMVTRPLLPLESTVEEARTIARLFPDSRVRLGADATEGSIKAAHAPRLLHLATHGFFLPELPVPEALLRTSGAEPTPAENAALLQRENPLLRSGIALAGFNRRRSGEDDGVLTALEVAGLDLYGTRLVVLSACESGVGEAISGEGVYGLRRALTMAGSEAQVMSLWQVDTGRTRELMQAYYERLQGGAGRSEAMRDVQLAMLSNSETEHPNLWASFLVSGEWRTLEGQARPPDLGRVSPGARGCACEQAGGDPWDHGAWLSVALGGVIGLRRRRSRRRE